MTSVQKILARHALGLDGKRKESYRNRYYANAANSDHKQWMELVEAGLAVRGSVTNDTCCFYLTHAGAKLALEGRERLDTEDFQE